MRRAGHKLEKFYQRVRRPVRNRSAFSARPPSPANQTLFRSLFSRGKPTKISAGLRRVQIQVPTSWLGQEQQSNLFCFSKYANVSDNLRASAYMTALPNLPVSCGDLDGESNTIPIIYEDVYRDEEIVGDPHRPRRHSLSKTSMIYQSQDPISVNVKF